MFCNNCGKELTPGTKFCENCGTKVEEPVAPAVTPVEEAMPVPEENTPVAPAEQTPAEPPKKKKKGLKLVICAVIILAIVGTVALAFPYIKDFRAKTFMPEEKYYASVEKASLKDGTVAIGNYIDTLKANADSINTSPLGVYGDMKMSADITLEMGDGIINVLSENAEMDLSFLKKIGLGFDFGANDKLAQLGLNLALNGNKVINAKGILDTDTYDAYVSIPQLSSTAMKLDTQALVGTDLKDIFENEAMKQYTDAVYDLIEALPEGAKTEKLVNRYLDTVIAQLDDVEKSKEEVSVGDIDMNCTAVTVTIKEKTLENIILALAKEVKDDDELWAILENFAKAIDALNIQQAEVAHESVAAYDDYGYEYEDDYSYDYDYEDYEVSVLDSVKELRGELEDNFDELDESLDGAFDGMGKIEYTVYTNAKGEIVGRKIEYETFTATIFTATSGKKHGFELVVENEGYEVVEITADGEIKNDIYNGVASISAAGQSIAKATIENLDTAQLLSGKITLAPSSTAAMLLDSAASEFEYESGMSLSQLGIDLKELELVVEFNLTKKDEMVDSANYKLALLSNGDTVVALGMNCAMSDMEEISLPESPMLIRSEDDFTQWVNTIDIMGFIGKLPSELTQLISSMIMTGEY